MILYADTSFLVKRFIAEAGSDLVNASLDQTTALAVSALTYVELRSVLAAAARNRRIPAGPAATLRERVSQTLVGAVIVDVSVALLQRAGDLTDEAALRALCRQLLIAQEEERHTVARELHEGISQSLAGLNLWLATAESPDPHLEGAQRLVTGLTERARRLAVDLRPPELDDFNLLLVLRGHLRRFEQRSGIRAELLAPGGGHYFSDPVQTATYRIVEEALANVERHAGVSRVGVELTVEAAVLTVTIRDAGAGFDPATTESGRGLGSMQAWAELLGGVLDIRAATGEGVTVTAALPVAPPAR